MPSGVPQVFYGLKGFSEVKKVDKHCSTLQKMYTSVSQSFYDCKVPDPHEMLQRQLIFRSKFFVYNKMLLILNFSKYLPWLRKPEKNTKKSILGKQKYAKMLKPKKRCEVSYMP